MASQRIDRGQYNANSPLKALRHCWILLVCSMGWLMGPSVAVLKGQTYLQSAGSPTFSTRIPVENGYVDASNGRLHLEIPMASNPQRGFGLAKVLMIYDSNIWTDAGTTSWQPTNIFASNRLSPAWSGWRIATTGDDGQTHYTYTPIGKCGSYGQEGADKFWNWTYTSPNGTVYSFPTVWTQQKIGCTYSDIPSSSGWSSDGNGYWLSVTNYSNAVVYAPDGTKAIRGYITWPEDSNGNSYGNNGSPSYSPVDTLGRTMVTATTNGNTITYVVPNAQGTGTSAYQVTTATINVKTQFAQLGITECGPNPLCTLTIVRSIQLPDSSQYTFKYDCDSSVDSIDCSSPSAQAAYYGLLTSMTLPTGGQIAYSWGPYIDSQGNHYEWINHRTTPDNSTGWSYTPAVVTTCGSGQVNCQQTFKMVKPSGDQTIYTFTLNGGAWASQVQYYNQSTTLLATTNQCWKYLATITNGACPISPTTGSPATQVQKVMNSTTLSTPAGSVTKSSQYTPDSYGNYTMLQEYNYYTGQLPGIADRTTCITYLNSTNYLNALILNRPSTVTVVDNWSSTPCTAPPAAHVVAQTNYCYDYAAGCGGSSFASVAGVINHDDANYGTSNLVRGDLTQVKKLISGTTNFLTTSMTYDMTGQVTTSTDSAGHVTTYSYANNFFDDNGLNPPSSHSATAANAFPTTITPAISSLASTFGYYFGTGQLASATDPNGNTIYSHFADSFNRPTSSSQPNGGWSLAAYDLAGSIQSGAESYVGITSTSGIGCSSCRHDKAVFDTAGLGRVAKQFLVNDPDGQTEIDTTFDGNGRVATVSNPYRSISDSTYGLETFTYDGLDRPWKVTHADGNVAYTYYGSQITGTLGQTTQQCSSSTYGMGFPVLVVDEAGNKRETWTDGFGRVIETDEPNSSGILAVYTCYTYDLNNNLTKVTSSATSPNQTRAYTYDMLSRITSKTEPETGTTCFYYTTSGGTCGVPASGTLCNGDPAAVCRRTDGRGITTTYSYDAVNRLTVKSYSDSTLWTYYYYDVAGYSNSKGRLTGAGTYNVSTGTWPTSSWLNYDQVGNVTVQQEWVGSVYQAIYYTYNYDGSIATIKYPGGRTVTYAPGNAQRAISAKDITNSINYAQSATYAPPGELASVINGFVSGGFAGITEGRTYNNRLEVTGIQATSSAGTAVNLAYSYVTGNNGNIATQTNNATSGRTQTYTYDSLNRLLTAQAQAASGGDCWGQSFGNGGPPPTMATDALANLFYTSSIKCTSPAPQYTMNTSNNNQFTGTGISYDPAGDMTTDTGYTYTYDAENRIITASGMTGGPYCYTYDFNGLRVEKAHANGGSCTGTVTVDILYTRNTAGNTITETDGAGSTTNANYNEYVFFAGRRIAESNPSSNSVYYYFVDHLESTRVVTTGTGTACYEADFLPYGTENTPAGFTNNCPVPIRYKFTGYERDAETAYGTSSGNDYAFARYYNTRLGRFMSADPLGGDIADPQTLNRYASVRNDPINFTDPTGQYLCGTACPPPPPPTPPDSGPWTPGGDCDAGCGPGCVDNREGTWGPCDRQPPPPNPPSQVKPPAPSPNALQCQQDVIDAMKKAWAQTSNGTSGSEAGFNVNGNPSNYKIVPNAYTNESGMQTATINAFGPDKTFANFHVHPNSSGPFPSTPKTSPNGKGDTFVGDKYNILMYVISSRGLALYDPSTKASTMLRNGLDWSKPCK